MARPSYAKSQHVILDFQRIVVFVTFTWSHFVCSQDADAGLDEDEIVRVAHMYRVVAGDSVSRSLAHLDFTLFLSCFCVLIVILTLFFVAVLPQGSVLARRSCWHSMPT